MKWVIMIILFVGCVLVGYVLSLKYKRRVDFFSSLIFLAQKLDVEINFSRERLKKLIEAFDEKSKKNLMGIDTRFLKYLEDGGELTSDRLFDKKSILKNEEKELITLFFRSLGRSDVENQSKEIKNYISRFEKLLSESSAEYKKYGKLGTKLGIAGGLAVVILMI